MKKHKYQIITFAVAITLVIVNIIGLVGSIIVKDISRTSYILAHINSVTLAAIILFDAYILFSTDVEIDKNEDKKNV